MEMSTAKLSGSIKRKVKRQQTLSSKSKRKKVINRTSVTTDSDDHLSRNDTEEVHDNEGKKDNESFDTKEYRDLGHKMEILLDEWILEENDKGVGVTYRGIQKTAKRIFDNLKRDHNRPHVRFVFGDKWFKRVYSRLNLVESLRGKTKTYFAAQKTIIHLSKVPVETSYLSQQVFCVADTSVLWKNILNLNTSLTHEITAVLCCNASGECKTKPFLISKTGSPSCKERDSLEHDMFYAWLTNESGASLNAHVFKVWFEDVFLPDVREYCSSNSIPLRIVLHVEDGLFNPEDFADIDRNIKLKIVPEGSLFKHPVYQGIAQYLKMHYIRGTLSEALVTSHVCSISAFERFLESYNLSEAMRNIAMSWDQLSTKCLKMAWKSLCPLFYPSEPEMSSEYADLLEDIVDLAEHMGMKVTGAYVESIIKLSSKTGSLPLERINESNHFKLNELTIVFKQIGFAMDRLRRMDPNPQRCDKAVDEIAKALKFYKRMYDTLKRLSKRGKYTSQTEPNSSFTTEENAESPDNISPSISPQGVPNSSAVLPQTSTGTIVSPGFTGIILSQPGSYTPLSQPLRSELTIPQASSAIFTNTNDLALTSNSQFTYPLILQFVPVDSSTVSSQNIQSSSELPSQETADSRAIINI